MFLTEYNEEKVLEKERMEGVKEGIEKGIEKGADQERERVATDLIKEGGMSVSFIARISKLSEDSVRNLAKSLGMVVI